MGDDRQYGGNAGYEDDLTQVYRFDSNVANHKRIAKGDVAVLRDRTKALGTARIESVSAYDGIKLVRRCPVCRTTGIKLRRTMTPAWRCNKKHVFDTPLEAPENVTKYDAFFGESYSPVVTSIPAATLKAAALRPSDQLSIEELDLGRLEELLASDFPAQRSLQRAVVSSSVAPDEGDASTGSEFVPTMADQREATLRAIKARRGQQKFRRALVQRYGPHCVITGCQIMDLLEAAHIVPYRGDEYNDPSNGLLLRADIHTLFDLGLLRIDPATHRIEIDDRITDIEYRNLHGRQLNIESSLVSKACLQARWGAPSLGKDSGD